MRKMNVCLAWHNLDSSNYGVSALAIAHLTLLVEAARKNDIVLEIDTLGFPHASDLNIRQSLEKRLGITVNHIGINLKGLLKDTLTFKLGKQFKDKKYDYVFDIGEGDSFADIYGFKRFFFLSITKYLALSSGSKLILAPQTIGPFKNAVLAKVANNLMNRCTAIYVRDFKSKDYLTSLGVESTEVSDVAFLLPFDKQSKLTGSVGLNVSGLLWHGGYTKNNQFGLNVDYQSFVKSIVEGFIARGKSVHLVAHVISDTLEVEDDYRVIEKLKSLYLNNPNVIVAPKFMSPIEAKSYMSQLEFFVGSRMHSTIGSLSAGVVTVPLAYSRKFTGVFGSIGYPYTLDLFGMEEGGQEELFEKLFSLYDEQYDEMQVSVTESVLNAKKCLNDYIKFLKETLK